MPETRKLAAILAADVAGYSRRAGADEEWTLARLPGAAGAPDAPAVVTRGVVGAGLSAAVQRNQPPTAPVHTTVKPRCCCMGAKSRSSWSNEWRCSMQNVPMIMSAVLRIVTPKSRNLR